MSKLATLFFCSLFLSGTAVVKAQPCPPASQLTVEQLLQQIMGAAGSGGGTMDLGAMPDIPPGAIAGLQCALDGIGNVTENVRLGLLMDDVAIIAADLWADEPKILSALPGFDGIIGLDGGTEAALAGGATFVTDEQREELCGPGFEGPASSAVPFAVGNTYTCENPIDAMDGFPICFSWPVLPSSINNTYLLYKRSDGEQFNPNCISNTPNFQYNERHCVVIFDYFLNRKLPDEEGYLYMSEIEIVGPLMLVGPDGPVSMEGTTFTNPRNQSAYDSGPVFVGARLVPLHDDGEGLPASFVTTYSTETNIPNSGSVIYESEGLPMNQLYRLRTYYSGGMTPDGLTGLSPDMFDRYFALDFSTGQTLATSKMGMMIDGTNTTVSVLGLADTGIYLEEGYTPCYLDDRDNYIDIIMHVDGDPTVLETTLTSFTAFSQQPGLYNPGGPGPFPFEGVRYVAPAPQQTFPIDVDLNRAREVTYCIHQDGTVSTDIETCTSWIEAAEMEQFENGQLFPEQVNMLLNQLRGMLASGGGTGAPVTDDAPASDDALATEAPEVDPSTATTATFLGAVAASFVVVLLF